jgi:hypothetical protein
VTFGAEEGLPYNRFIKLAEPGAWPELPNAPALFYHPEGKFDPYDSRVVWLVNDHGYLYEIDASIQGALHRGKRRIDIERHHDLTRKERDRRRSSDDDATTPEDRFNVPNSPDSSSDELTAEQDERSALRQRPIPDDVRTSPLDSPSQRRFTPLRTNTTLPTAYTPNMATQTEELPPVIDTEVEAPENDEFRTANPHNDQDATQEPTSTRINFFSFDPDGDRIREMRERALDDRFPRQCIRATGEYSQEEPEQEAHQGGETTREHGEEEEDPHLEDPHREDHQCYAPWTAD